MNAEIVGSRVLHFVQFAPDPQNKSFPTAPQQVETRLVREVTEFPEDVKYISFHDVVETQVRVGNRIETVRSGKFNETGVLFVLHSEDAVKTSGNWNRHPAIEVHPSLKGKIWVFGSHVLAAEQNAA